MNPQKIIDLDKNKSIDSDKKTQILKAAEYLFTTKGFHKTQIADIAKAAGTGIGTFYRYFPDKDELLKEIIENALNPLRSDFVALRKNIEHKTPLEQFSMIRETFRLVLEWIVARPPVSFDVFRNGYGVNLEIDNIIWSFIKGFAEDMVSDMKRAEAAGLLKIPHPDVLAHSLTGMVLQAAHKLMYDNKPSVEETVDVLTRFTLGGLLSFAPEKSFDRLMPVFRLLIGPVPGGEQDKEKKEKDE